MADFMKGNFKTKRTVKQDQRDETEQINEEFERTALRRLGGSIAFVSRKGFLWNGEESDQGESGGKPSQ